MTLLEVVIFLSIFDIPRGGFWRSGIAKFILTMNVTLMRIGFGFVSPLVYRDIARRMPENSEKAGQLLAFWTQLLSMVVNITMFSLSATATFGTNVTIQK